MLPSHLTPAQGPKTHQTDALRALQRPECRPAQVGVGTVRHFAPTGWHHVAGQHSACPAVACTQARGPAHPEPLMGGQQRGPEHGVVSTQDPHTVDGDTLHQSRAGVTNLEGCGESPMRLTVSSNPDPQEPSTPSICWWCCRATLGNERGEKQSPGPPYRPPSISLLTPPAKVVKNGTSSEGEGPERQDSAREGTQAGCSSDIPHGPKRARPS